MPILIELQRRLSAGETTARGLVEESLAKIEAPKGEGRRAFLTVYAERARNEADLIDSARTKGVPLPAFAGVPISIKDLFDTAGEPTRAASRVLDGEPPASADADAVKLVRRAGFIVIGKNNMTEFAYSGLGLNQHFPGPRSPFEREKGRAPGGSTSGGAVAVADGMVPATLGSDTGGSCRIPAAFCGVVGFKPTSQRVSKRGVFPLSETLDSVGPLAASVSCCAMIDSILSGGDGADAEPFPAAGLRLGVVEGFVDEDLEPEVAQSFSAALTRLARAWRPRRQSEDPRVFGIPAHQPQRRVRRRRGACVASAVDQDAARILRSLGAGALGARRKAERRRLHRPFARAENG